jgi:hypothetical protein
LQKDLIPPNIRIGRIQVAIVSFLIESDKKLYLAIYYRRLLRQCRFSKRTYLLAGNVDPTTDIIDVILKFLICHPNAGGRAPGTGGRAPGTGGCPREC